MTTIVAYVSSAAEFARADYTDPSDVNRSVTDPFWEGKSSMRWITFLGHKYNLGVAGECPGRGDTTNYSAIPPVLCHQAKVGGWSACLWAHSKDLYDSTSGVTLAQFADAARTA